MKAPSAPSLAVSLAIVLCLIAAALLQLWQSMAPDDGWLIVLAGRMLDGAQLYTELIEVNPPMSVFIYVPVVLLQRVTGLGADPALFVYIACLASLSVIFANRILAGAGLADHWRWAAAASFVLLVLPLSAFGQREHIALIAVLPFLAATAAQAAGARSSLGVLALAGLCGGLGICVKPHFVLVGLLPALYTALRLRSLRSLFALQNCVAGAVVVAYALVIALRFPAFLSVWLPILDDTYRPFRMAFRARFAEPAALSFIIMTGASVMALRRQIAAPRPAVFMLAGLAFFLAALEQGKMWANHLYPALALALLVVLADVLASLLDNRTGRDRLPAAIGAAAALCAFVPAFHVLAAIPATTSALANPIRALVPERPRLYAFSGAIAASQPLTAEVGGVWTGPGFGQWLTDFSRWRLQSPDLDPALRKRLEGYEALDLAATRAGMANNPDFVLVDRTGFDWRDWAMTDPELRAALGRYARIDAAAGVELWARRDLLAEASSR